MRLRAVALAIGMAHIAIPWAATAAAAPADSAIIRAAIRSGRLVQARAMLVRLPDASDTITALLWADLALAEGRNEDALRGFDALAKGAPDSCAVLVGRGIAASRAARPDQAISALTRATGGCRVDWQTWNALAVAHDAKRQWAASASSYARAIALSPSNPILLNNVGMSYLQQLRFAEAGGYFEAALRLAPENLRIVNNLDIARASLGQAPVRDPRADDPARWAERLGNAGRAALLAGRTAEARRFLAQAIATDPTYQSAAATSLGTLQARQSR